jgi:hypothetical protein
MADRNYTGNTKSPGTEWVTFRGTVFLSGSTAAVLAGQSGRVVAFDAPGCVTCVRANTGSYKLYVADRFNDLYLADFNVEVSGSTNFWGQSAGFAQTSGTIAGSGGRYGTEVYFNTMNGTSGIADVTGSAAVKFKLEFLNSSNKQG